jgi:hypothetical protein
MLSSNNLKVKPIIIVEKIKIIHSMVENQNFRKGKTLFGD